MVYDSKSPAWQPTKELGYNKPVLIARAIDQPPCAVRRSFSLLNNSTDIAWLIKLRCFGSVAITDISCAGHSFCANDGFTKTAVIGDLAAGMMKNAGVAAFVTDGLSRDKAGIVTAGLPLFSAGIQPNSPAMNGPAVVGAAIDLGGVHVNPGDLVVGVADGVVVVPAGRLELVLERLRRVQQAELLAVERVLAGATMMESARKLIEQAKIVW